MMKWASAIAEGPDLTEAVEQCAGEVADELGHGAPASLVVVFVSAGYAEELREVPTLLQSHFPDAVVLGCCAAGVIGNALEIEHRPAVAVTAGHLPGVGVTAFRATRETVPSPDDPPESWTDLVGVTPEERPSFLILMDPFAGPGEELLAGLDFAFPAASKVGGLASGGQTPGSHVLYLGKEVHSDGAVGVALTGDIVVDTVVAQGCRPIGKLKRITSCHNNALLELDGEPPFAYLQEMYETLPARDQSLMNGNLFLGIAMDPLLSPDEVGSGDFLIRNLIGADRKRGILAIGEILREGLLVQFHVRDAITSAEDLQRQLVSYFEGVGKDSPAGALLFQCNGRGMNLYGKTNHDSDLFKSFVGTVPLGGLFCNGEIGQVGGTTYLHGYTSSFALFRKPQH